MKYKYIYIVFCIFQFPVWLLQGQSSFPEIDSLCKQCLELSSSDFEKSIYYSDKGLSLAKEEGYIKGIVACLHNSSISLSNFGQLDRALSNSREAEQFAWAIRDSGYLIRILNTQGIIYSQLSDFKIAENKYRIALNLLINFQSEKARNKLYLNIYNNLGRVNEDLENNTEAENYYSEGLSIALNSKDTAGILMLNINLSNLACERKEFNKAIKFIQKANSLISKDDVISLSHIYSSYANIYKEEKKYQEAIKYFELFSETCKLSDNQIGLFHAEMGIGEILHKQNKFIEAEVKFNSSYELANQIGDLSLLHRYYYNMYNLKKDRGEFQKSLLYHEKYNEIGDSLLTFNRIKNIDELNVIHKIEKIEAEKTFLKKENSIKSDWLFAIKNFIYLLLVFSLILGLFYLQS